MKLEITKDGTLEISLRDLVERMSKETRDEILKQLCADETLFAAVVDQLADGAYFDDWWFDSNTVNKWRAKLDERMPGVVRLLVRGLIHERDSLKKDVERAEKWAWTLYHAWPDSHWRNRPNRPPWTPTDYVKDDRIEAIIKGETKP